MTTLPTSDTETGHATASAKTAGKQRRTARTTSDAARLVLSEFVVDQARKTSADIGLEYFAQPDAPRTFADLRTTYERCLSTGDPLPVSNEHSDSVIFTDQQVNFAMRFWHDVNHIRRNLTFDLVDELELSLWHLSELEAAGFAPSSLEWQLLHADLVGQVYVMSLTRRFPLDQRRFAEGCLVSGFDTAILHEARDQQPENRRP